MFGRRYMGLRTDVGQDGTVAAAAANATMGGPANKNVSPDLVDASGLALGSLLRQIFALSSEQLDDMLEEVAEGKTWKGIVPVPSLLTPTTDPGPAQVATLLAQGGSSMTAATPNRSQVQVIASVAVLLLPVLFDTLVKTSCFSPRHTLDLLCTLSTCPRVSRRCYKIFPRLGLQISKCSLASISPHCWYYRVPTLAVAIHMRGSRLCSDFNFAVKTQCGVSQVSLHMQ